MRIITMHRRPMKNIAASSMPMKSVILSTQVNEASGECYCNAKYKRNFWESFGLNYVLLICQNMINLAGSLEQAA
jgi:hypothetical protein